MIKSILSSIHFLHSNANRTSVNRLSNWSKIPLAPADAILGLNELYNKDNDPMKVNLGVGAYRDEAGAPSVLKSVSIAKERLYKSTCNHEYASISGVQSFIDESVKFAYGADSDLIKNGQIAAVQALSGTGACRLFAEFIAKFFGKNTKVYLPNPTVRISRYILQCLNDCID
jgi:aspartate aminotransferase